MKLISILCVTIFLFTCSNEPSGERQRSSKPDYGWKQVAPIVERACKSCHSDAPFVSSGEAYKSSKAPARVANKSMPPNPDALSDEDRARLAAYARKQDDNKSRQGY